MNLQEKIDLMRLFLGDVYDKDMNPVQPGGDGDRYKHSDLVRVLEATETDHAKAAVRLLRFEEKMSPEDLMNVYTTVEGRGAVPTHLFEKHTPTVDFSFAQWLKDLWSRVKQWFNRNFSIQ